MTLAATPSPAPMPLGDWEGQLARCVPPWGTPSGAHAITERLDTLVDVVTGATTEAMTEAPVR